MLDLAGLPVNMILIGPNASKLIMPEINKFPFLIFIVFIFF